MQYDKIDNIEKEKRIRIVMEWILEDWSSVDIINNIIAKWGVSERQAQRYIKEGRTRWVAEERQVIDHKRRLKVQSLKKLKRSLDPKFKGTPQGIHAIMAVEKQIIALEQLEPARKLELSGVNGSPIQTENTTTVLYLPVNERFDAKEGN